MSRLDSLKAGVVCAGILTASVMYTDSVASRNIREGVKDGLEWGAGETGYEGSFPWDEEPENAGPPATVTAGHIALESTIGGFVAFVPAEAELNAEFFGKEFEDSKASLEGYVVSRIKLPNALLTDTLETEDAVYMTRFQDGQDVGIDLTNTMFVPLNPGDATEVDGELQCETAIDDPDFTGCMGDMKLDNSLFSEEFEDPDQRLVDMANILFDQFAQIEACHFDKIFIPFINATYKKHGYELVDGADRHQQALEILVKGILRDYFKGSIVPQAFRMHFVGQYQASPSVNTRLKEKEQLFDFPFKAPEHFDPAFCAQSASGQLLVAFANGDIDGFQADMEHYAIMGRDQVSDNYDPYKRQFVENSVYVAPDWTPFGKVLD